MARIFEIDIDSGKILVDDKWQSAEELSQAIQQRLASGDFKISSFSEALERLVATMESARELRVIVTRDVADSFDTIASARGVSPGRLLREVLVGYLASEEATNILFGGDAGSPKGA